MPSNAWTTPAGHRPTPQTCFPPTIDPPITVPILGYGPSIGRYMNYYYECKIEKKKPPMVGDIIEVKLNGQVQVVHREPNWHYMARGNAPYLIQINIDIRKVTDNPDGNNWLATYETWLRPPSDPLQYFLNIDAALTEQRDIMPIYARLTGLVAQSNIADYNWQIHDANITFESTNLVETT